MKVVIGSTPPLPHPGMLSPTDQTAHNAKDQQTLLLIGPALLLPDAQLGHWDNAGSKGLPPIYYRMFATPVLVVCSYHGHWRAQI